MFAGITVVVLGLLLCVSVFFGMRQLHHMHSLVGGLYKSVWSSSTRAEVDEAAAAAVAGELRRAHHVDGALPRGHHVDGALPRGHSATEPPGPGRFLATTRDARPPSTRTGADAKYARVREAAEPGTAAANVA
jgi:hypothetical protein